MKGHIVFDEDGVPRKLEDQWVRPLNTDLLMLGSMSKERAQYIIANTAKYGALKFSFRHEFIGDHVPIHEDGINEIEDAFIKMTWSLMSDDKSYHDAITSIAEGK